MIHRYEEFNPCERYLFDFDLCTAKKGWAQVDTTNDAPYFGNWANPKLKKTVSYAEGDVVILTCDTEEEFIAEMKRTHSFFKSDGEWLGVDVGLDKDARTPWDNMGLGYLLYPTPCTVINDTK